MTFNYPNPTSIRTFYSDFDFSEMVGNPPAEIRYYRDAELAFLKNYFEDKPLRILEVGCGYGRLLSELENGKRKVVGIDFSEKQIERARRYVERTPTQLAAMDASKLGFKDNSFDIVCCLYQTLGNMPGIEQQVINEMYRVCKPNGEIITSVFSENALDAQLRNYERLQLTQVRNVENAVVTDEGFYSRRFSREDVAKLFEQLEAPVEINPLTRFGWLGIAKKRD